jgi:hypothetical protein
MLHCAAVNEPVLLWLRTQPLTVLLATEAGVSLRHHVWKRLEGPTNHWILGANLLGMEGLLLKAGNYKLYLLSEMNGILICSNPFVSWAIYRSYSNPNKLILVIFTKFLKCCCRSISLADIVSACLTNKLNIRTSKTWSFCRSVFGIGVLVSNYE